MLAIIVLNYLLFNLITVCFTGELNQHNFESKNVSEFSNPIRNSDNEMFNPINGSESGKNFSNQSKKGSKWNINQRSLDVVVSKEHSRMVS